MPVLCIFFSFFGSMSWIDFTTPCELSVHFSFVRFNKIHFSCIWISKLYYSLLKIIGYFNRCEFIGLIIIILFSLPNFLCGDVKIMKTSHIHSTSPEVQLLTPPPEAPCEDRLPSLEPMTTSPVMAVGHLNLRTYGTGPYYLGWRLIPL